VVHEAALSLLLLLIPLHGGAGHARPGGARQPRDGSLGPFVGGVDPLDQPRDAALLPQHDLQQTHLLVGYCL
jgi:hypothetical protein